VETDDDDACTLDEADPKEPAIPELWCEDPDDPALGRSRRLCAQQVVDGEVEELQAKILAGC
jgi:hypothetical protein